jgi:8-oxo-dGTP pyrophosphatase MutT (NUDIX family)
MLQDYFFSMEKNRPKVIPAAYLVLVKEEKVLLSRRYKTGFQDGYYSFPAGHLKDDEETLSQTMIREAREEIGIEVDSTDLALVHVMHRKQQKPANERRISLFFTTKKWKGEPRIMEPTKCDDLQWFELDSLPDNTTPYIKQAIDCIKALVAYSEYGFSTPKKSQHKQRI